MSAVGHVGGVTSPTSSWTSEAASRPLSSDSMLRIELSLSSRRSTAVVMRCTARLYSLEVLQQTPNTGSKGTYSQNWHSKKNIFLFIHVSTQSSSLNY